jgi:hypothetical protein
MPLDLSISQSTAAVRDRISLLALIRRLFAGGEQGVWYDIADRSTLFQDSAGTTPVTSPGDPVGLMLDKSRGAIARLGPELVANGDFSAGSDWTLGTGWSIGSGVATKTAGTASLINQVISIVAGRAYELTYTLTRTAGTLTPQLFGGTTVAFTARSAGGTFTQIVSAVTGNTTLRFSADASFAGTIDDVTVKELTGNHATQSVSAARPIYGIHPVGGIRNLLTHTEDFSNAVWGYFGTSTLAASGLPDPFGGNRAARFTAGSNLHSITQTNTVATGQRKSIYARSPTGQGTKTIALLGFNGLTKYRFTITEEWQRFDVASNASETGGTAFYLVDFRFGTATQVELSLPQNEPGSTATAYQRVGNRFDVTEAGVSSVHYLSFNGTSQFMVTPSIDFTGTDAVSVFTGLHKASDAARGSVAELTASIDSNNGGFHLTAPNAASDTYAFESKGTTLTDAVATGFAAPSQSVVTGLADISVPTNNIRVNGSSEDTDTGSQGTGNYANAVLNIGSRGGTSLFLNGNIYSLIVRGALSDATQIANAEKFAARRTGITL